jgi:monovalent cation:proton antiporter-2 (CPA2) family protein
MHIPSFLFQALVYLAAAVIAVPLFKRLGLGSVLGYLVAGIVIGPWGFKLINDVEAITQISELGVVLLLFLVGLELNVQRLWEMRRAIFGLGGLQVVVTIAVVALAVKLFAVTWPVAVVIGMAAAMSSTAIALQLLNERSIMKTAAGQSAFSVALFQDLAVVPLMLVLSLLSPDRANQPLFDWFKIGQGIALVLAMILLGRVLLKPLFRLIAKTGMREIFIACALLLIVGSAVLTASVGLSMAMGSFLAGVLLADSEYRKELEVDIDPFKGLFLGLFFIAVGMAIDIGLVLRQPLLVAALALGVVLIKVAILKALGLGFKLCRADGWIFAIVISQIGEFAFVLASIAQTEKILSKDQAALLNAVVAFSMLTTPLLMIAFDRFLAPKLNAKTTRPAEVFEERKPVIIAGVGRVGQMVARVLRAKNIPITLIDVDPNQLELLAKFDWNTHYGDVRRPDVLEAAGVHQAQLIVLAIDDPVALLETAHYLKQHYPKLNILARARGRVQAYELIAAGVKPIRESFYSSLRMAQSAMVALGIDPAQAQADVTAFELHDEKILEEMAAKRDDLDHLVANARKSQVELNNLLTRETPNQAAAK